MSASTESLKTTRETCRNCGGVLLGEWCHGCGQGRHESMRLRFGDIAARFVENVLSFDTAILRTTLRLTIRPGAVCRDYVGGRRKQYMNPFAYMLLSMAIYYVVAHMTSAIFGEPYAVNEQQAIVEEYATWMTIAFVLPYAAANLLLFYPTYNFAENCAFVLYTFGYHCWIAVAMVPTAYLVSKEMHGLSVLGLATGYTLFATLQFYPGHWAIIVAKYLVTLVALAISMIVLTLVVLASFYLATGRMPV